MAQAPATMHTEKANALADTAINPPLAKETVVLADSEVSSELVKTEWKGTTSNDYRYQSDSIHSDVAKPRYYATVTPTKRRVGVPEERKTDSLSFFNESVTASTKQEFEKDLKKTAPAASQDYKTRELNDDKAKESAGIVAMNDQQKIEAKRNSTANRKVSDGYMSSVNTFRGRVTDNNNNGLPFANVTNTQDNVGTYADAKGFFNLTSTDSILNVQVRSNGFNSNNFQLRNNISANQVVLQEDKSLAVQTLPAAKINYERHSRDGNMKLEGEPEPEDGWEYYDSYLTNNLVIPEEALRQKQTGTGSVDISFEVNKYGEPIKFKIEKSLCEKCDQEAIRLIKEGPKWKRKAKKGRTIVTISF